MSTPRATPALQRPGAMRIPTPEELGVSGTKPVASPQIDWTAVHSRLDHLGATCFQREKLPTNGWRITLLLPTNRRGWSHRIDAQAASEADAVRLLLAKTEEWAGGR